MIVLWEENCKLYGNLNIIYHKTYHIRTKIIGNVWQTFAVSALSLCRARASGLSLTAPGERSDSETSEPQTSKTRTVITQLWSALQLGTPIVVLSLRD